MTLVRSGAVVDVTLSVALSPVVAALSAVVGAAVTLTEVVFAPVVAAVAFSAAVMLSVICGSVRQHTYYQKANQDKCRVTRGITTNILKCLR